MGGEKLTQPGPDILAEMLIDAMFPEKIKLSWARGTEVEHFVPGHVRQHLLDKSEASELSLKLLEGYQGILYAQFVQKPPEDITLEIKKQLLGTDIEVPETVLRRDVWLRFWFQGVEWGGIRGEQEGKWPVQATRGRRVSPKEWSILSWGLSLINPDRKEFRKVIGGAVPWGNYVLGAGDFGEPLHIIMIDVSWERLEASSEWIASKLRKNNKNLFP